MFKEEYTCDKDRSTHDGVVDVEHLIKFVRSSIGGVESHPVLTEVDEYSKSLKKKRDPSPMFLGRMASLDLPPNVGLHWRAACVNACMCATDPQWTNAKGESKYLAPNDVAQMAGNYKKFVLAGDDCIRMATHAVRKYSHM